MPERNSEKRSVEQAAQSKKFIDAAREHDCDEDEAAFEAKLKKIASVPLSNKSKRKKKSAGK